MLDRTPARRRSGLIKALLVVVVLCLPACATGDGGAASESAGAADAPSPAEDADAAADTRTVTTVAGAVEVPEDPQRIVTTHNIATQPLVDLGVEPVGVGDLPEESAYPEYWEQIAGLPTVGNGLEVDLEQVAALSPDLIFAINQTPDEALDALEQMAPVVVIGIEGPQRADWQGRAELVAEVMGREDELAALVDEYDARAEEIASVYADVLADETFVVLDTFEAGSVVPYGPSSMVGEVLEPAGITFAPSASSDLVAAVDESPDEAISYEQLPEVTDGSVILHGTQAGTGEPGAAQQDLLDSALLASAPAAAEGSVYPIGKTLIAGYDDAFACLDLFAAALEDLDEA